MLCFGCNLLCIRIFATVERKHGELLVSAVFLYGLRFMILCESATGIYTILRRRVDPSQLHSHSGCIYYILPIREPRHGPCSAPSTPIDRQSTRCTGTLKKFPLHNQCVMCVCVLLSMRTIKKNCRVNANMFMTAS